MRCFMPESLTQAELIGFHRRLSADMIGRTHPKANDYVRGHYEHLLMSLQRLIEMHGPTEELFAWMDERTADAN